MWFRSKPRIVIFLATAGLLSTAMLVAAGCGADSAPLGASASDNKSEKVAAANTTASTPNSLPGDNAVEDVTFAQITDAHLFDAGKRRHSQSVYEEAIDNRAALHWAIIEINRTVASGQRIDFVAFTGDWGLENVEMNGTAGTQGVTKKCDCPAVANDDEGPVAPVKVDQAADEVAFELKALVVRHVYLVPGNNDLCNESPKDLHRYAEFVEALKGKLPGRIVDLTHTVEELAAQNPGKPSPGPFSDNERGFYLLGLNSASFKDAKNFANVPTNAPGHPYHEIENLAAQIQAKKSYLIFTHIPDLADPFGEKKKPGAAGAVVQAIKTAADTKSSAWALQGTETGKWETAVKRSEVLGVFAGHFHSADRAVYGVASEKNKLAVRGGVASKTWVAPPLAIKFQYERPEQLGSPENPVTRTARGFLLATVTGAGAVTVTPRWFVTLDAKAASDGDVPLAEAQAEAGDERWDKAAAKYAEAMKSTDARVRATATAGYLFARGKQRECWWMIGPIRWIWVNRICVAWILAIAFVLFFVKIKGRGILWFLAWLMEKVCMPSFRGAASVLTPAKLTGDDAKVDLFASELSQGAEEVRDVLKWFGVSTFAGPVTLLALPSDMTDKIATSFPEVVKGVDLGKIFGFLIMMGRYFTWRVESKLAYCSDPPAPGSTARGTAGEVRAYATLRWAWFTKGAWALTRRAQDVFDLGPTAFGLAARILWEAFD